VTTLPPSTELADARALAARRDWLGLAARLRGVPEAAFVAEPELGFLFADACRRVGDTATALRVAAQVEPEARRTGNRRLVLEVVNLLGMTHFEAGRLPDAAARWEELLSDSTDWGDDDHVARAANGLGVVANVGGRREAALTFYQRALAGYTRVGNRRGLAQTHYNLGISFRDLKRNDDADSHYRRAMELAEATESEDVIALAEVERAELRVRGGDGRLAMSLAAHAGERFRRIGDPTGLRGRGAGDGLRGARRRGRWRGGGAAGGGARDRAAARGCASARGGAAGPRGAAAGYRARGGGAGGAGGCARALRRLEAAEEVEVVRGLLEGVGGGGAGG
jgi:tetratricopeptide (TPR) repeat protein